MAWDLLSVIAWVVTEGYATGDLAKLSDGLSQLLRERGLPLMRTRISFLALHPQVFVRGCTWNRGAGAGAVYYERPHAVLEADSYKGSPAEHLRTTQTPFRRRLVALDEGVDHTLLLELARDGGTDYFAVPGEFSNGSMGGSLMLVTDGPGGFTDADLAALQAMIRFLSPILELFQTQHTARTVLNTYVGPRTGARVLDGKIRRGDSETIKAALWFSDLRNFTYFTETLPLEELLRMLNEYFELVAAAVTANGGGILRFIGDAMLIVFPEDTQIDGRDPCSAALDAARDAFASLATVNFRRRRQGVAAIEFGVGLHVGEVICGNVGAPDRLDFTVMGAAVNRTARLESLTKELDTPLLVSAEFAARADCELCSLGAHAMKGVPEAVEVFVPED